MRRTFSFWESRIDLSENDSAAVRALIATSADTFIDRARLAGGEYKAKSAAWSGATPAEVRRAIETLGSACADARAAIEALPLGADSLIRQGQVLDASRAQATDAASGAEPSHPDIWRSMDTTIEDLRVHLRRIASACTRAANLRMLNQGQGKEPDYARRSFIRELGEAYTAATGKQPARRSDGQFAKVARIVLKAAGADPGISNDLLISIFGPASGKSR